MNKTEQLLKAVQAAGERIVDGYGPVMCGIDFSALLKSVNSALSQSEAPAEQQCGCCGGTGRMVRDPDIGTDQECFACAGTGTVEDEQPEDKRDALTQAPQDHIPDATKMVAPQERAAVTDAFDDFAKRAIGTVMLYSEARAKELADDYRALLSLAQSSEQKG